MSKTILHVVFSLEAGGMENGLVNVARALDPAEFAVAVCCLERAGEFAGRLPSSIQVSVCGKPPGFSPATIFKLRTQLRQLRPAVVHTHNLGPLIYAALAGAQPLLHGEHGMLTSGETRPWPMWMRRRLYGRCAAVHAVSHSLRDYYVARGFPAEKITAIPNGVDTVRFAPADQAEARQRIGLPKAGLVAGMVGSLQRRKRHREVIEAFNRVAAQTPEARLLIVGTPGPEAENIRAQIAASPAVDRIHLFNFQADPRPYYQAMDLLLVASENEGLSNAALEAMACGVPVLASEACGNAEIIVPEQDGFLGALESVDGIQARLAGLMAQPQRLREAGIAAREKVAARFQIADMAEGYTRLYRQLAGI